MPHPFTLDSKEPTLDFQEFLSGENRFASLQKSNPTAAEELFQQAEKEANERFKCYQKLSTLFE
jgi:pyruvate-ferredoxin/flavodoxin oxidoreductase